jgi:hypothetical protein
VSEVDALDGQPAEVDPELGDIASAGEEIDDGLQDEPPPRQYVEIDDPDNRYVRIKVDGEDVEVPFSEALRGYSREADYTRKAQTVAELRQQAQYGLQLQQALESNPELTLQILAQQYQLDQQRQATPEPEPEFDDPLERQLYEERQARIALEQRFEQRESDRALEMAVGNLRSQYQLNDDDVRQVVGIAAQTGLGLDALPMVWKTIAFDRIQASVMEHQRRQAAETQQRTTAKAAATQTVASGRGAPSNNIIEKQRTGPITFREAAEQAWKDAGGT